MNINAIRLESVETSGDISKFIITYHLEYSETADELPFGGNLTVGIPYDDAMTHFQIVKAGLAKVTALFATAGGLDGSAVSMLFERGLTPFDPTEKFLR